MRSMYRIIYSQESRDQLDIFINSYKWIFTKLFIDFWIQDVELIISNYENIWDNFYTIIRDRIWTKIATEKVLWRKMNWENNYSLIFKERNFLIIVDYTEDTETKTRYIENIIFTRK